LVLDSSEQQPLSFSFDERTAEVLSKKEAAMDQPANKACCPNCGDGTKLLDAGKVKVMEAKGEVLKQRLQCLSCKDTFLVEGKVAEVTEERLLRPWA